MYEPSARPIDQILAGGLAMPGTHLHECMTCCESIEGSAFTEFCYAHYKITGDSEQKRDPRHMHTVCFTCLSGYCEGEISAGKLFVKCPMCPRALQVIPSKLPTNAHQYCI